jgi:diguanylate cyclase (GGDEF)-like protein
VLAAALPVLLDPQLHPLPAAALVIGVPLGSLAVLVSTRTRFERECDALRRSALSDPLTGIANRRSLEQRIDYEISRHARIGHSFALVLIDLDGFKALNDRFGHAAGDDLLREAAGALSRTVRAQDTAARIGGDEFCVLAPETDAHGIMPLEDRIREALAGVTSGVDALSASAGTAIFPGDGTSAESLMAAADQRLLAAKRERQRPRGYRRAA